MKGIFLSAVMATFAFGSAAFAAESYSGGGDWNSSKGLAGKYTTVLNAEDQKNGDVNITQEVTVASQSMKFQFIVRPTDDMRFKIVVGAITIGYGYCWNLTKVPDQSTVDKICHYHLKAPGGQKVENSLHITSEAIYEMGSIWDATQKTHIAFKGKLTLVTPED